MKYSQILLIAVFYFIGVFHLKASDTIVFSNPTELLNIGSQVSILEDETGQLTINEVVHSKDFVKSNRSVPDLGITSSNVWLKIKIKNTTAEENLVLSVNNPMLDKVALYAYKAGEYLLKEEFGDTKKFSKRDYDDPNYLFNIFIPKNISKTFFLKVKSWENIYLPIKLANAKVANEYYKRKDFIFGIYSGVIIVMVLYNLFIFLSVRDKSYFYYIIFILFIALTQTTMQGYPFKFLFSNNPEFVNHSLIIFPSIAGIATIEFMKVFLKTKVYTPYLHKGLIFITVFYLIATFIKFIGFNSLSFQMIDINATLISLYAFFIAIVISIKGYRPAKFFLLSWSVFLLGVILFVLENVGVLSFGNFTVYTMSIGTVIEVTLLSFALADRINTLKQEKLAVLEVNQQLITNQNIALERKVRERTVEIEMQKKKIETQRLEEVKSLRYKALTAQMNPHFIFNALNSIRSFVLNNDSKQADRFLTKFSKLIRAILDSSREDYRFLSDEINSLNNYLEIEQLRFENKFEYSITVEESLELGDIKIPSFIVQPYVENAVLHGMLAKESGQIMIDFRLVESKIVCVIEDNGCGRKFTESDEKAHKSVSMSITKERLAAIGDFSSVKIIDLKAKDGSSCGTRVEIIVDLGEDE